MPKQFFLKRERESKEYYKWLKTGSREYDVALEERIRSPVKEGMLIVKYPDGSVRFDDRKLRFDGIEYNDGIYVICVGPTHFDEMRSVDLKARKDVDFFARVRVKGI